MTPSGQSNTPERDEITNVWVCPLCGWVDNATREVRCVGGHTRGRVRHRPVQFLPVVRGAYLPTETHWGPRP